MDQYVKRKLEINRYPVDVRVSSPFDVLTEWPFFDKQVNGNVTNSCFYHHCHFRKAGSKLPIVKAEIS